MQWEFYLRTRHYPLNFQIVSFLLCNCKCRQCHSENRSPVPCSPLWPCNQLIYNGKGLDWNRKWLDDWLLGTVWSIVGLILHYSSQPFEEEMGNVLQLHGHRKYCNPASYLKFHHKLALITCSAIYCAAHCVFKHNRWMFQQRQHRNHISTRHGRKTFYLFCSYNKASEYV